MKQAFADDVHAGPIRRAFDANAPRPRALFLQKWAHARQSAAAKRERRKCTRLFQMP
jgi:hypothetical protein